MNISELLAKGWIQCKDGDVVSPKEGDRLFITEGTLTVKGQTGGDCWARDNATLNATGQISGDCRAWDNATLNATGQTGGVCRARDNAKLIRKDRKEG